VAGLLKRLPEPLRPGKELIDMAKELDKAYISTRYPNVHPEGASCDIYTEVEARRLIGHARRVVQYCEDILARTQ